MSRAHVTEELIQVVKVQHKKYPAFTQKELAEKIGCSAATVGRILAGKYDDKGKRMDNNRNFILTDMVKDENGKIRFVPRDGEENKEGFVFDGEFDPKTCKGNLGPNDTFETSMDDEIEALRKGTANSKTIKKHLDKGFIPMEERIKSYDFQGVFSDMNTVMNYLNYIVKRLDGGYSNPNPMTEERFRQLVATEIITLRQTQVDMYKELKQLKGILADIRDMLK